MSLRPADDRVRTALVTGACSGIGLAIARRLASAGYDLVVVSQRAEELQVVTTELTSRGVRVTPIVLDLARPEAARELHARTHALGHRVDVLVNNAGMLLQGPIVRAEVERANALLQLHVVTPSLLATLYGRELAERRAGFVLFVSSISAWRGFPGIGYYASSKRYLRAFAEVLRLELGPRGVGITTVLPGATATAFYDERTLALGRRFGVMVDPDYVALAALEGLFAGRGEVIPGLGAKLMAAAFSATPAVALRWGRRGRSG